MSLTKRLEHLTKTCLPPAGARLAKRMSVGIRYRAQLAACRAGYAQFGDRYPHTTLFIAGLPKSGTTWLERMIASYEGFHELMIPEVARHEMRTGGSHDYELPDDMFTRFRNALVLTKMHIHASPHNTRLLRDSGIRYVVLYRDLRDVAVSNYYYVRNFPWHPEHKYYRNTCLKTGLYLFADRTLGAYRDWIYAWRKNRDPELSMVIQYEDLLEDDVGVLRRIAKHFGLDSSDETIERITKANSFREMSGGREKGQSDKKDFTRKGIAGDWKNYFDDTLREKYKEIIGQALIDTGHEKSFDW